MVDWLTAGVDVSAFPLELKFKKDEEVTAIVTVRARAAAPEHEIIIYLYFDGYFLL
ncbi:MAG TPA: hypothetical protein VHP38_12560 [Ruminiclostridium sp.]|nr:hypothetical protein [Ruminiclostridium sp.]